MYQFSRAIYRDLAPFIATTESPAMEEDPHAAVLHACEATVQRLASDRHYFAKPARTLFNDIRMYFPMSQQRRVCNTVTRCLELAQEWLAKQPRYGVDINGVPLQCRATTRRGTPCQRLPLPRNGYCPSHQHLAETEDTDVGGRLAAA